jgi:site-specific DNA-methyltransferase (adenine-specific)
MKQINMGKQMRNVWEISAPGKEEKRFGKHPTQKPLALLERIILASSKKGDLILDPFNGSGTTGIASIGLDRKYIGIDLEKPYLELTKKRYAAILRN